VAECKDELVQLAETKRPPLAVGQAVPADDVLQLLFTSEAWLWRRPERLVRLDLITISCGGRLRH
jgi:hypothetical protein